MLEDRDQGEAHGRARAPGRGQSLYGYGAQKAHAEHDEKAETLGDSNELEARDVVVEKAVGSRTEISAGDHKSVSEREGHKDRDRYACDQNPRSMFRHGIRATDRDDQTSRRESEGNETHEVRTLLLQPGGRALTLEGFTLVSHPFMVSELGGIGFGRGEGVGWGYSRAGTEADFVDAYSQLLGALNECRGIAGFCYTQLTDTFQEKNGLLTADRTPKADVQRIAEATRGRHRAFAMDVNPLPVPEGFAKQWRRRRRER